MTYVFLCDAATCGMTHCRRCWLWLISMLAAKFWCLRLALALCWELSWREWEVRLSCELICSVHIFNSSFFLKNLFNTVSFLFVLFEKSLPLCRLYNYPLQPPPPGYGSVIQMYPGGGPVRAGVESFGFPAHFHDMLHDFPICHVNALLAGTLDTAAKDPSSAGRGQPCCF